MTRNRRIVGQDLEDVQIRHSQLVLDALDDELQAVGLTDAEERLAWRKRVWDRYFALAAEARALGTMPPYWTPGERPPPPKAGRA